MTNPPLNFSARVAVELTAGFIDLNAVIARHRARSLSMLYILERDLSDAVRGLDLEGRSDSARMRRMEKLLRDTRATIRSRYATMEARSLAGAREVATLAHDSVIRAVNTVFTVNILTPTLTRPELQALADTDIVLGSPAKEWWEGQAEDTRRRFARQMRLGIQQGETNDELVRRIRGKSTGRTVKITNAAGRPQRVREFAGGIMDARRREADALVRTSAQSVSNAAIKQVYDDNPDIIKGYEAITTLDDRTSKICMARTGAAWFLESGDPIPGSTADEPFPGPPPWHFNCRTVLGPLTYTWEELVERSQGQRQRTRLLNTVPDSVRTSMDGLLASDTVGSFDDFLKIKGDAFARKKLGPGLFDLWRSGKITTSQLIDQGGRIVPVRELAARTRGQ